VGGRKSHGFQYRFPLPQRRFCLPPFLAQLSIRQSVAGGLPQTARAVLQDVIIGAGAQEIYGRFLANGAGNQDEWGIIPRFAQQAQRLQASNWGRRQSQRIRS
jgi:hypothetical protein